MKYRFSPSLLNTILTFLLVALFIRLGQWQWDKAEQKRALQSTFDARLKEAPVALPQQVADVEPWRYRRIRVQGQYEPSHQILLDNQMQDEAAGYHVLTPFKPVNSETRVLVDRGWIVMGDRSKLPQIATPQGAVSVVGFAWVPSLKFYELQAPQDSATWQLLWQNMDMRRYAKAVPFKVLPFVIRLDADSSAGGFVRGWAHPAERIEMHVGYAYQWYGFAVVLLLIYLVVNMKKKEHE